MDFMHWFGGINRGLGTLAKLNDRHHVLRPACISFGIWALTWRHWSWRLHNGHLMSDVAFQHQSFPALNGNLTWNVAYPYHLWPEHNDQQISDVGCTYRPWPAHTSHPTSTWPSCVICNLHMSVWWDQTWTANIICRWNTSICQWKMWLAIHNRATSHAVTFIEV